MKLTPSIEARVGAGWKYAELICQQGLDELGPADIEELINKLVRIRHAFYTGDPEENKSMWFTYYKTLELLKDEEIADLSIVPCAQCLKWVKSHRPYKLRVKKNDDGVSIGYHYFCSEGCIHAWTG